MERDRLKVLVVSDLFPSKPRPAYGIFVELQTRYMGELCRCTVVVPTRVFPPLQLWRSIVSPRHFYSEMIRWWQELSEIPRADSYKGIQVHYPRYTSLPRQIFHSTWGFFAYPFVRKLLKRLEAANRYDLIHAHYASPAGVIALLMGRWLKVPTVLSIHGSDLTYTAKQNRLGARVIKWVFRHVDLIVAQSSWTEKQIIHFGGPPERIRTVRLGANPTELAKISTDGQRSHKFNVLTVGYLETRKGHAFLLQSVANLIHDGFDIQCTIVGGGTEEANLRELARKLMIDKHVKFEGLRKHEEVWAYYSACDVFVLPSWDEAFGVVYIEALSMGKPVIGCEGQGGPEDIASLGDCISLVRAQDVSSLQSALEELIGDPERRRLMGEIGQQIVAEYFNWETNADALYSVYQEALSTKPR